MPHINLLPWREEIRRERQRLFINIAVGAAILMVGIIILTHLQIAGKIETQEGRNQFLEQQITSVNKEIEEIKALEKEKAALLARMKIIQELQSSRSEVVHLFDEIAKAVPDRVYLTKLDRKGPLIQIEGFADSNGDVSEFMRKLNASPWLGQPKLAVIETGKADNASKSRFQLEVVQHNPQVEEAKK